MTRPLRIDLPDGVYHVTSRGLEKKAVVRGDADRKTWLELLGAVATRRRWRVLSWALMDNHFHLFLRTPGADLSAGMHDLNSGYASAFNRRHGRSGPLFQGRFNGILVEEGGHYWELSRYIHLNPVRAGIVGVPERYLWSSCAGFMGLRRAPEWLAWEEVLCHHGRTVRAARREYARFLAEGVLRPPASPLQSVVASTLLGSEAFIRRMTSWLRDKLPDRDVPAARILCSWPAMDDIESAVCRNFGVSAERLRARYEHGNDARMVAMYLCRLLGGATLAAVGARFGVGAQAVSNSCSLVAERRRTDHQLDSRVRELIGAFSPKK